MGNPKVCLAVVSIKQESGLVLKLLVSFGVVNLAGGSLQHAKGNEAGEREKLHCPVAYLAPALNALSSYCKFRHPAMREPGQSTWGASP